MTTRSLLIILFVVILGVCIAALVAGFTYTPAADVVVCDNPAHNVSDNYREDCFVSGGVGLIILLIGTGFAYTIQND